jgi:hypothetical protein
MRYSFCEEDFVVTGYAGEFVNAISSVAYSNARPLQVVIRSTNVTDDSLARRPRAPAASEGLIHRCEDLVLWSGLGGRLFRTIPRALEIPRSDV